MEKELKFCMCGCGEKIQYKNHHKYYTPKFIHGHSSSIISKGNTYGKGNKGKVRTIDVKNRISNTLKMKYATGEIKKKYGAESNSTKPEARIKNSLNRKGKCIGNTWGFKKGMIPINKNKHASEKTKILSSISHKKYYINFPEAKKQLSKTTKLQWENMSDNKKAERNAKITLELIERWKNKEYKEKTVKAMFAYRKKMTSVEKEFNSIIKEHNLGYKFVGSGDNIFFIGSKVPDFINFNKKILIETYYTYYKKIKYNNINDYKIERYNHFLNYGYKTIFFDENELLNKEYVFKKIQEVENEKS